MVIALALLVGLAGIPAALGLIALVASFVRPKQWEIIAVIVSGPVILAAFVGLGATLVMENSSGGDAGPLMAVQAIFMTPFVVWYLSVICGGAFAGRWLAERLQPALRAEGGISSC
jgi:hypothetical protein